MIAAELLFVVVLLMCGTSAILAVLDWNGQLEIWHLALASFINGCGWCTDNPVRRVMIGEVVGREQMGTAMSLDVGANNASRMVGPAVGGFLLASTGIQGAFILGVMMYCTALWAVLTIRSRIPRAAGSGAVRARIAEGLAFVRADKRLIGVAGGDRDLQYLRLALHQHDPRHRARPSAFGPGGRGPAGDHGRNRRFHGRAPCGVVADPEMVRPGLSLRCRLLPDHGGDFRAGAKPGARGRGIADDRVSGAGFATMQATLVYLAAPVEMRSRILGVLTVCIGTGPIGFLWLGWLADRIGSHNATAVTGVLGLLALAATRRWWKEI